MKVLMVCLGNICRSPMAEGILQQKVQAAGLNWQIDSAGTESYHVGENPHKWSIKTCNNHGIDISKQVARRLKIEDFQSFDVIYALATDVRKEMRDIAKEEKNMEKVILIMDELYPNQELSVKDPYYGEEEGYEEVFQLLDKLCDAIIEKYR